MIQTILTPPPDYGMKRCMKRDLLTGIISAFTGRISLKQII
jgi:hypothetical protein